jgi:hypothetical protein
LGGGDGSASFNLAQVAELGTIAQEDDHPTGDRRLGGFLHPIEGTLVEGGLPAESQILNGTAGSSPVAGEVLHLPDAAGEGDNGNRAVRVDLIDEAERGCFSLVQRGAGHAAADIQHQHDAEL